MQDKIFLCEKPHPVIQGEGINMGRKMILLRTFGCPLQCPECDSRFTWSGDKEEYDLKSFFKIIKKYTKKYNTKHILLTGGEPGLYISFLEEFFKKYQDKNEWEWDIESSGIYDFSSLYEWEPFIQFNFSPKVGALYIEKEFEWKAFENLPSQYIIKVVISKDTFDEDILKIKELQLKYNIEDNDIYLMPKGVEKKTIIKETKWLIKQIFKTTYNFSPRLHILIYNNKRLV